MEHESREKPSQWARMLLPLCGIFLGVLAIFLSVSAVRLKAADDNPLLQCREAGLDLDEKSGYADFDLSTEDVMVLYHQTINEKFNEYIATMIKGQKAAEESGQQDPNGLPPAKDPTTGQPQACTEDNYSTYCVAQTLLSSPYFGHMAYRQSLLCRKKLVFDSSKDISAFKTYSDAMILGSKNEQNVTDIYQSQKALEVSGRSVAIDRELSSAKQALDQTLAAYNELKVAWPMHKKYMKIYDDLLKFRDKMVEIRHQVEEFPAKFIDVTTTQCT